MNRLAFIVVLGLLSGTTHGTFEVEDPAAEIFEELQALRDGHRDQRVFLHP